MIIATTGHIDHGKSSLIRAITGVDTDTLPEERSRGISIDLGFAHWSPDPQTRIGFIDVPGHERFVRNMLAGVCAIDMALLVVAADDGVMPQTVEHVQILNLLDVRRCIVVVTKQDRVDSGRIREVVEQCHSLLGTTAIEPVFTCAVSSLTGTGIEELKTALTAAAAASDSPRAREGHNFRLAVDRVFMVAGRGTIATGTVWDGRVAVGDRVVISPAGVEVRIRALQCAGMAVEQASAGQRCAINIAGVGAERVARGDWLVAPAAHLPTQRILAKLTLLAGEHASIRHLGRVHLHLGTAKVVARVLFPQQHPIEPGGASDVTLLTDQALCASNGDRFILRDQGAARTIGGGYILNALDGVIRFGAIPRSVVSHALSSRNPRQALEELLAASETGLAVDAFMQIFNLDRESTLGHLAALNARVIGGERKLAFLEQQFIAVQERLLAQLAQFHRLHSSEQGMSAKSLRALAAPQLSSDVFVQILRILSDQKRVAWNGVAAYLPSHKIAQRQADVALWQRVSPWLSKAPGEVPTVQELARLVGANEFLLEALLHRKRAEGEIWMINPKRFFPRSTVASLASIAAQVCASEKKAGFTAAQYRDAVQTGRTLAIQILEFFDRVGATRRIGDRRKMLPDHELLFGPVPTAGAGRQKEIG